MPLNSFAAKKMLSNSSRSSRSSNSSDRVSPPPYKEIEYVPYTFKQKIRVYPGWTLIVIALILLFISFTIPTSKYNPSTKTYIDLPDGKQQASNLRISSGVLGGVGISLLVSLNFV